MKWPQLVSCLELQCSQSKIKLSGECLKCRVFVLSVKGPLALDTTSAYCRAEITLKMIGLQGEAISPCASNEVPEASRADHRNNFALEDFEGRRHSETTCDGSC